MPWLEYKNSTSGPFLLGEQGGKMPGKYRKHTPITSEAQRGLFGAELARRRAGKKGRMGGITSEELEEHLHESKGKNLPARKKKKFHKSVMPKLVSIEHYHDKEIEIR